MWGGCLDVSAHLFGLALDSCRLILLHTVWQVIASSSAFKLACLHLIGWKAGICTWIISILPEGCQSVLVHFSPEFENTFMKGEDSQSTHRKWATSNNYWGQSSNCFTGNLRHQKSNLSKVNLDSVADQKCKESAHGVASSQMSCQPVKQLSTEV